MNNSVYKQAIAFKKRYPLSVAWRIKAHSKIIESHLNPGEQVLYVFAAQKNDNPFDIITSYVCALTNRRLILAQKRLLFGYFFISITPDLFNDLKVNMGILWGKVYIDTAKEVVPLSNIQKDALNEIETNITEYMMEEKKKYANFNHNKETKN